MKKRQINDEMMDSVLKTMLSEYQEEEGRKILKETEELNKSDEYAPTKQQIKEFEKIRRKLMDSYLVSGERSDDPVKAIA